MKLVSKILVVLLVLFISGCSNQSIADNKPIEVNGQMSNDEDYVKVVLDYKSNVAIKTMVMNDDGSIIQADETEYFSNNYGTYTTNPSQLFISKNNDGAFNVTLAIMTENIEGTNNPFSGLLFKVNDDGTYSYEVLSFEYKSRTNLGYYLLETDVVLKGNYILTIVNSEEHQKELIHDMLALLDLN